jgi:hypothetical protein
LPDFYQQGGTKYDRRINHHEGNLPGQRRGHVIPLTVDLGIQGHAGKREGVTGSLQVKFEF